MLNLWPIRRNNTTTLDLPRSYMNTLALFFKSFRRSSRQSDAKGCTRALSQLNDIGRTQEFSAQTQDAPAPNHSKS